MILTFAVGQRLSCDLVCFFGFSVVFEFSSFLLDVSLCAT